MFLKFRVNDGEYIIKISRGVVKHVYKVVLLRFVNQKTLITQRLRDDLGWSVGVNIVFLRCSETGLGDPKSPTNRKSCIIKRTHI